MLLGNSRIKKGKNIKFYEQDILIDNNIYTGNIQVNMEAEYITPGLGLALITDECLYLKTGDLYLFRVGHGECSLIKKTLNRTEVIANGSIPNVQPYIENFKLELRVINNRAMCYVNGKLVIKKYLPTTLNKFCIGYYSNAGNVIKSVSIASMIPNGWVVNMSNTDGGYVKFDKSKFTISNCADKAEIEQLNIRLDSNEDQDKKYYLKFNKSGEVNDITAYVFKSNDNRYNDEEKNILEKDGSFIVKSEGDFNIKFTGTCGTISNVQITERTDDYYVATDYDIVKTNGSSIKIEVKELEKIEWAGVVDNIPSDKYGNTTSKFGVVKDDRTYYHPADVNVKLGERTEYVYNVKDSILEITNNGYTVKKLSVGSYITIFINMDCSLDKLILYKLNGDKIDILDQDIKKQFVPGNIKSPIVVTNDSGDSLDLSSSYRVLDNGLYSFTNIEREIFEPTNRLRLQNPISDKNGTVTIYGVLKDSDVYEDKLLHDSVKGIDKYCTNYEKIEEADLYSIDKDNRIIVIFDNEEEIRKYKQIVIDYLKQDSYAINYRWDLGCYELDISSSENTKVYYDGVRKDSDLVNATNYKVLDMNIKNNSYVVLKGR